MPLSPPPHSFFRLYPIPSLNFPFQMHQNFFQIDISFCGSLRMNGTCHLQFSLLGNALAFATFLCSISPPPFSNVPKIAHNCPKRRHFFFLFKTLMKCPPLTPKFKDVFEYALNIPLLISAIHQQSVQSVSLSFVAQIHHRPYVRSLPDQLCYCAVPCHATTAPISVIVLFVRRAPRCAVPRPSLRPAVGVGTPAQQIRRCQARARHVRGPNATRAALSAPFRRGGQPLRTFAALPANVRQRRGVRRAHSAHNCICLMMTMIMNDMIDNFFAQFGKQLHLLNNTVFSFIIILLLLLLL